MNIKYLLLFFSFITILNSYAQPPVSASNMRIESWKTKQKLINNTIVHGVTFESIGPSVMSGRVVDVEVNPEDPTHFYVAYASGGLWETKDNGISFSPLFDHEATITIGDIAVRWGKSNIIWIGTGENNSSRSSYAGTGVYKSEDNGKTWQHMGLTDTQHIGRIVIHPSRSNIVWVASIGHLYSDNDARGIYKTTDSGKTWKHVLKMNDNTGAIDLVINKVDPNDLYVALWQRERKAWDFSGSGNGSGIYKSSDGGFTWEWLTNAVSGFPNGENVGRIGLTIHPTRFGVSVYAIVDNQNRRPKEDGEAIDFKEELKTMSDEDFQNVENKKINSYLKKNDFPEKYNAEIVKEMVSKKEINPNDLVDYTMDANALLFDTPVIGAEVYKLNKNGRTWKKTHEGYLDDLFFSYGYYFGQIAVHPENPDILYISGVPILISMDGGVTFESINGDNQHADHHAVWVNPAKAGHIINGNDGGINISFDNGEHWIKCNSPAVGQFYTVNVDMDEPYNVYGGLQDNGVWKGPSDYEASDSWQQSGHYPYKMILGGDGMQVEVDTRTNNLVYTGYQFGHYYRINTDTDDYFYIKPKHDLGETPLRFNWQTPIYLSRHNQDIFYMGSNKFHRSMNKGENLETLSEDLTKGGKKGNVSYGTLTSIHESSLRFGLIYVGSDDGLVHVSKDVGYTWENISTGLPEDLWVSRVQASSHKLGRVYLSLNGYRWDDFNPYVYRSDDFGKTWEKIGDNLPSEPINVIKEDPENENLLYVGTDNGLYVSFDRGLSFTPMMGGLPNVAVHDLVIHPREYEIIIGTHGRSLYKADVSVIQQLDSTIINSDITLFELDEVRYSKNWGNSWSKWLANEGPSIDIPFYWGDNLSGENAILTIKTSDDKVLYSKVVHKAKKGLNYVKYNLTVAPKKVKTLENYDPIEGEEPIKLEKADNGNYYLVPGNYVVEIKVGQVVKTIDLIVTKQ
jgi:photosystem II stability/assembly factor-like uncharacterized protein